MSNPIVDSVSFQLKDRGAPPWGSVALPAQEAWWASLNTEPVKAGSVYASPSVQDGDGSGTELDPYSLRGAVYNSVLGAEIILRGGTYTLKNPLYTDSDYREENATWYSWTSTDINNPTGINPKLVTMNAAKPTQESERITFRSYPGEVAEIDCDGHSHWWILDNCDFYSLKYFNLVNVYIGLKAGFNSSSQNNNVSFFDIRMNRGAIDGDNTGGIMVWGPNSDGFVISKGKIVGPGIDTNHNSGCVYLNRLSYTILEDCYLSNSPRAVHGKHPNDPVGKTVTGVIRNNFIDGDINVPFNEWEITNNIVTGDIILSDTGGTGENGALGTDNNTVSNNTVVGDITLSSSDNFAQDNSVTDNICSAFNILRYQTVVQSTNTSNYNLIDDYVHYQNTVMNMAEWQANALSQDANSINGVPTFISMPPTVVADYELAVGSLGKNANSIGADMGADVSTIGAPI